MSLIVALMLQRIRERDVPESSMSVRASIMIKIGTPVERTKSARKNHVRSCDSVSVFTSVVSLMCVVGRRERLKREMYKQIKGSFFVSKTFNHIFDLLHTRQSSLDSAIMKSRDENIKREKSYTLI